MTCRTLTKKIVIPILFFLFLPTFINAQEKDETLTEQRKLETALAESKSIPEKIRTAGNLASFHFTHKNPQTADSLLKLMFDWANQSGKKEDMFAAYKSSGIAYNNSNLQKALVQYQLALDYAIKEKMPNEEIFALISLGILHSRLREFDKSLEYYTRVELNKEGIEDSSRFNYFYRKSALFFAQGKILEGIKHLFQAKKYAEKTKISEYIAAANHALGENFLKVKEYKKAITYYTAAKKEAEKSDDFSSVLLEDLRTAESYGQMKDYLIAEKLFTELIRKADSAGNFYRKYSAVLGLYSMFYYQNEFGKVVETATKYDLIGYHVRNGDSSGLYSIKGVYAEVAGNYDSADWYYRRVIDITYKSSSKFYKAVVSFNYAEYLKKHRRYTEALPYMKSALSFYDSLNNIIYLPPVYQNLDSIYTALGDNNNALLAYRKYNLYKDSLDNQNKKEDILKAEIVAEEESIKKTEEEEKKATERKHDIQYRFIILGGILLLIGLLAIGFFHPPKWLVRGLAFVSFIFIFEFIILILDSKLHHWFHGAPLPILGVKVLIACLLVPLHHLVEKKVIHFLQSKKLHRLKTVFKDEQPAKT